MSSKSKPTEVGMASIVDRFRCADRQSIDRQTVGVCPLLSHTCMCVKGSKKDRALAINQSQSHRVAGKWSARVSLRSLGGVGRRRRHRLLDYYYDTYVGPSGKAIDQSSLRWNEK